MGVQTYRGALRQCKLFWQLAASFQRASADEQGGSVNGAIALLSDHPATIERETRSRGSPFCDSVLTALQWAVVRAMCGNRESCDSLRA
jgi:hypothetical protein